jgi:flavin-dependent dehydrogenase
MFSYFLLGMAELVGVDIDLTIFEPRFFTHSGPAGCNHCGGIISESLVQLLATEGINLPEHVVQRGIDSYMLHMDVGDVRIETPLQEKRIAAVYRGHGPRESVPIDFIGFDKYLQELSEESGARIVNDLVTGLDWLFGKPRLSFSSADPATFDLVVVASGINSRILGLVSDEHARYRRPDSMKTFICEYHLGRDRIAEHLGTSMHVFLLDLPRLEFAAMIPKGDFVTLCLLGHNIDSQLVESFLSSPEVMACFPDGFAPENVCHCFPRINVKGARQPFADRLLFIGDSGVSRLYKDGIGAAYRTSKAAAGAVAFHGFSEEALRKHYWPACRAINLDNALGKFIFGFSHLIQKTRFSRRGVLRMTAREQASQRSERLMSSVLWDLFTGSAPYRDVLMRTMKPAFIGGLISNLVLGNMPGVRQNGSTEENVNEI